MPNIVDVSYSCGDRSAALVAEGIQTIIRYYTRDSSPSSEKRLKRAEALQHAAAGLRLCIVHEGRRGDDVEYFDGSTGKADGLYVLQYAEQEIDQPTGSAIYFGVDTDASDQQIATHIVPYFKAIRDAFSAAAGGAPHYKVGVYGSGLTCGTILDAGLCDLAWLAQSTGWRGYSEFLASNRWTMKQGMPSSIGGVNCDPDTARDGVSIGDFTFPNSPVAHPGQLSKPVAAMTVKARNGLNLRSGPGTEFSVLRLLPLGTTVFPSKIQGSWTAVDLAGDGAIDGFVSSAFLSLSTVVPVNQGQK